MFYNKSYESRNRNVSPFDGVNRFPRDTNVRTMYFTEVQADILLIIFPQKLINRAAMGRARFLFCTGFIINRAAMGRARFLFCTGFIINRAAMGRARFLFYTGFINRAAMGRARFLFYTGFIINRAAMGRARFLLYTGFIFFFRFFVGDQTQTSTRQYRDWGFEITQPMMFIRQKLLKH